RWQGRRVVAALMDHPDLVRAIIVDDNEDIRLLLKMELERDGRFEVLGEAADGLQGIMLAERTQPDVIILDLAMPVMDGLQALPELKRVCPAAKIVVLSAFSATMVAEEALACGADTYVEKGVAIKELADIIAGIVSGPMWTPSGSQLML
ncbi:MAG TPA: response regulator transcription factor, partial [Actinomycetota bacterium]|nr:response regulator transcription factor [Actinomycetota bacterium]